MKVIIIDDEIINFNNVGYVRYPHYVSGFSSDGLNFFLNDGSSLSFPCSKEEYQKIHKKIIDFLKDKDETILELNINEK